MVGLVVRKSARGFLGYFDGDFESPMWDDGRGERVAHPRVGRLLPGKAAVEPWHELDYNAFREIVRELDTYRKVSGILGLELGYAPPKSVSIAGLADVEVSPTLIATHHRAVDDSLALLSPLLVARASGELIPCGVKLLELPHPWNKSHHPQLHSHVVLLRDFNFTHALWTTPVFLLQRALREVYQYSLCSRLVRQGLRVVVDEPGNLAWELSGVPASLLQRFSERSRHLKDLARESPRGYFSQGAEFRVASWISRRQLPKTDYAVSLEDARKGWRKGIPILKLEGESSRTEVAPVALEHIFRLSSVLTRPQFIGAHLRWWLGAPMPLHEAMALAGTILDSHVEKGSILRSGSAYCWPERLDTEAAILKEITAGFGAGSRLTLPTKSSVRKSALKVLNGDNGIKIVSTEGLPSPQGQDVRTEKGEGFVGAVQTVSYWKSPEILHLIKNRGEKPLVIFVEEPFSVGDFSSQVERILRKSSSGILKPESPFSIGRKKLLVRQGNLQGAESGPRLFTKVKRWLSSVLPLGSDEQPNPGVILAPWLNPDELRQENWRRLEVLSANGGQQVEICRPLPWTRLLGGSWEGLGIFCHRTTILPVAKGSPRVLRTIRHGASWFFAGPAEIGMIPVVGVERKKLLPLAALKVVIAEDKHHLLLVEKMSVSLRPGVPLTCPVHFESDGQVFNPGHVFVVQRIEPSGRLHFPGGSFWPNEQLVMEPAFYVREFPRNQPELPAILAQAEWGPNGVDQIAALPPAGVTIISSKNPTGLCAKLDRELGHRETSRRLTINHQVRAGELLTGLEPLFPPASIWMELRKNLVFPYPGSPPLKAKKPGVSPQATMELSPTAPEPIAPRPEPGEAASKKLVSPEVVKPAGKLAGQLKSPHVPPRKRKRGKRRTRRVPKEIPLPEIE